MLHVFPQVIHTYKNWLMDSARWDAFTPRDDDIVIATPYKSGTTWMQLIVGSLVFRDRSVHDVFAEVDSPYRITPWLDMKHNPIEEVIADLEGQTHRRFIKTHLPLDGLPYYRQLKYIIVSRDARDVFMSLWNHHRNLKRLEMEEAPQTQTEDLHAFWHDWTTRGFFPWESEGYPYWSNLRHTQTWWDYRHLPNFLFVHFNNLLADLPGEIRRIAAFLEIPVRDEDVPRIVHEVTFSTVKEKADRSFQALGQGFEGGAQTFFHKGTNGRWKSVLSDEELALYDAAAQRELSDDCRAWLESAQYTNP